MGGYKSLGQHRRWRQHVGSRGRRRGRGGVPARYLCVGFAGLVAALGTTAGLSAAGAASSAAVAAPPGRATPDLVALPGTAPAPPSHYGATVVGAAPAGAAVHLEIYLQPRGSAALADLSAEVATPGAPSYHHYLSVAQFAARFGASAPAVAGLDGYLRSRGLKVSQLAGNRLAIAVSGTSSEVAAALGTRLEQVRDKAGADLVGSTTAPRLPARLGAAVAFIGGLSPWATQADDLVRFPRRRQASSDRSSRPSLPRPSVPRPSSSGPLLPEKGPVGSGATCNGMAGAGMTPAQLSSAYGLTGFYSAGDEGQGETIGLIEYALPDTAAVAAFQACTGSSVTLDYDPTASPPGQVNPEVAADIEVVEALAPRATIVIYESDQSGTGLAPWEMAVSGTAPGGLPEVVSSSWGSCEAATGMGSSYYRVEESLYEEAAVQGQTVLVATGDNGSEGCFDQTQSNGLAVDDPASAPAVTAVGGTASNTVTGPQYVWNSRGATPTECLGTGCDSDGAGGGGASTIWRRPAYQPTDLPQAAACPLGAAGCREIPDVSALAGDPYAQYCSADVCGGGSPWVGFGGTSLAAPSWGAAVLLTESMCTTHVGFLDPLLYAAPRTYTGEVTSGDNDFTGTNLGLYRASPTGGYSMAAGLGYLGGADLSSGALCGPGNQVPSPATATTVPPATTVPAPTVPPATTVAPPTTVPAPTTTATGAPSTRGAPPGLPGPPAATACTKPTDTSVASAAVAIVASTGPTGCAGYWVAASNGQVAAFGSAKDYPLAAGQGHARPRSVVAMAAMPGDRGYWLLEADGHVYAYGAATAYGPVGPMRLASPAVGMAATPDGRGYWVTTSTGGVYAYGDARFYGSVGALRLASPVAGHLDRPIVGIAALPSGRGYWLVAADGGVFSFGHAGFYGSMAGGHLDSPVVSVTAGPGGSGYRMAAADGGVFSLGAGYYGSLANARPSSPVASMAASVDSNGYYLVARDGEVYAYGDAPYLGSAA